MYPGQRSPFSRTQSQELPTVSNAFCVFVLFPVSVFLYRPLHSLRQVFNNLGDFLSNVFGAVARCPFTN